MTASIEWTMPFVAVSVGCLGIRHLVDRALNFGGPEGHEHRISRITRKHIHELVDPPRRRLERVTIDAVVFEVHESIAGTARLPRSVRRCSRTIDRVERETVLLTAN
jgi:hypothetical protein